MSEGKKQRPGYINRSLVSEGWWDCLQGRALSEPTEEARRQKLRDLFYRVFWQAIFGGGGREGWFEEMPAEQPAQALFARMQAVLAEVPEDRQPTVIIRVEPDNDYDGSLPVLRVYWLTAEDEARIEALLAEVAHVAD